MKKYTFLLMLLGIGLSCESALAKELRLWGQIQVAGQPVSKARLIVIGQDTTWTDASGNFAFEAIQAGHHTLRIDAENLPAQRFTLPFYHEAFLPLNMVSEYSGSQAMKEGSLTQPAWHPASRELQAGADPLLVTSGTDPNAFHTIVWDGFVAFPSQSISHVWWQASDQLPHQGGVSPLKSKALFQSDGRDGGLFDFAQSAYHQGHSSSQESLVQVQGRSSGGGIAFSQGLDIGPWNHIQLSAWLDQCNENELTRSLQRVGLEHQSLFAPRWRLWQQIQSMTLDLESPSILPRPMVLSSSSAWRLRALDQERQELRYRLRVEHDISEESRFTLLASIHQRETTTQADEEDLLSRRLPDSALDENGSGSSLLWLPTKRWSEETGLQVALLLDVQHDRGHLQTGLWLWQADEEQSAGLLASPNLPASLQNTGLSSWYGAEQERLIFGTHLSDRYSFGDMISVEARLDLRYHYWKQSRLPLGYFQLDEIPRLKYSEDLLSMEPRIAFHAHLSKAEVTLEWRRSRPFPSESSFWDLGQHPENPEAWPLIVDEGSGSEASNQYLLLAGLHDRLTLNVTSEGAFGKASLALFTESRMQGYQAFGDTLSMENAFPQPRATEAEERLVVGLDAHWEKSRPSALSFWAGLSLRHSRDQGDILIPVAGSDFQPFNLDDNALPWIPDWSCAAGISAPLGEVLKGEASCWLQGKAMASRFVEIGEQSLIEGRQDFDVGLSFSWPRLQVDVGVKNLLADSTPAYAWVQPNLQSEQPWATDQTTLLHSLEPQRTLAVNLSWRPFVRP